jgi:nitroreductase
MMDVLEAIKARRSIRRYKSEKVPREVLMRVLEAARLAPSAYNRQPFQLIVVSDEKLRKAIANLLPRGKFARESPIVIVGVGDPETSPDFYLIDTIIALEHCVIAAVNEGLGTCWIGLFDEEGIKKLLHVNESKRVVALLSMGYPAEVPPPKPKKSLEELIQFK